MSRSCRADRKPGFAPGFFLSMFLTSCGQAESPDDVDRPPRAEGRAASLSIPGTMEDGDINEASGIAHSRREPDLLWVHEDSGAKARIYAIDTDGKMRGRIKLESADNKDWEDIAAFTQDGEPYLVVADIGDNDARRKSLRLYIVAEPDLADDVFVKQEADKEIKFRYPDGPRDAEAIAVDVENERALILSKRDLPPKLYAVPLRDTSDDAIDAELLGNVTTLPKPSRRDVEFAPKTKQWHWQPTAMDVADDGSAIVILTYSAVYLYARDDNEDWLNTLQRPPLAFPIDNIRDAEAVAFSPNGRSIFVTVEKKHAPIVRIDFVGEASQ